MENTSVQPTNSIEIIVHKYGNMLFRLCLIILGNTSDAEDVVQETIMKYLQKSPRFENEKHEKAWFVKVATNKCRDVLRYKKNHPVVKIEEILECTKDTIHTVDCGIIDALMTLPEKFRIVLILYYVQEYSIKEIAGLIGKSASAVKMRLQKGRRLLNETYQREYM